MRKFEIYYNDGAFYGSVTFKDSPNEEIEKIILQEIEGNNKNINPLYHITRKNFIEIN